MKIISGILLISILVFNISAFAETAIGPKSGTLILVGGGNGSEMQDIASRFIKLAGGDKSRIVIIPTAEGCHQLNASRYTNLLVSLGAPDVSVFHTCDRKLANDEQYITLLKSATGILFGGGRQWRLVDAYKNTKVEKLLNDVLDRGGVIAGTSAGATIQGSYLVRGDTKNNQVMMGDHDEGFGYLKNVAIDQHLLARNRHFDMLTIIKTRPELLGIGIDENTAIIVNKDQFEVIGRSYVSIYDGSFWSREGSHLKSLPKSSDLFYFLRNGDKYDMKNRKVILSSGF